MLTPSVEERIALEVYWFEIEDRKVRELASIVSIVFEIAHNASRAFTAWSKAIYLSVFAGTKESNSMAIING